LKNAFLAGVRVLDDDNFSILLEKERERNTIKG